MRIEIWDYRPVIERKCRNPSPTKSKIKKIEEILFEMGLTTDLVVEGVNDRYEEGLEKLKEIGEYRLAKAIEEKQIFFNI